MAAGRSLGALTIDVVAKVGGFTQGMSQAERVAQDRSRKIERTFKNLQRSIGGVLAGLGATSLVRNIVSATAEAEQSMALLRNAVEQNGGAVGRTTKQLADMAGELQRVSTYGDETIQGAQQLLLRFQSIQGVNFDRALKSTLDLATALGMDLSSAAQLVGRALEDPQKSMTQLARSGVVLDQSQRDLVKRLVETGRQAEAQGVLLGGLEKRYAGAAESARNTLGGALKALKNATGELLEAKDGLPGLTEQINRLTATLEDPRTQSAFQKTIGLVAGMGNAMAESVVDVASWGDAIKSAFGDDKRVALEYNIAAMERMMRGGFFDQLQAKLLGGETQLAKLRQQLEEADAIAETIANSGGPRSRRRASGSSAVVSAEPLQLEEVIAAGERIRTSPMEDYYRRLDEQTRTSTEKQLAQLTEIELALEELFETGRITAEQYNERWSEAFGEVIHEVEVTAKRIGVLPKEIEKTNEYLLQAARSTEGFLADALLGGMEGKIDNIGKQFVQMIDKLVAQALAAQLAEKLFGADMKGGGWIDSISWGMSLFGGGRASGGPVQAGRMYRVNEAGGAEVLSVGSRDYLMMGSQSGRVVAAGRGSEGGSVTVINNLPRDSNVTRKTGTQIATDTARSVRHAMRFA